jgi:hypothetical protein
MDDRERKRFDRTALPFQIAPEVTVEDVSRMFTEQTFEWAQTSLGTYDVDELRRVRYAIVHRYFAEDDVEGSNADMESEKLIRNIAACLRLIRPMRQNASLMRGKLLANGTMDVGHFEHPPHLLDVPEVEKLFHLRNSDLDLLKVVVPDFLHAMRGEFWKFRMAVEFHEGGHFQAGYWKARYLLWCSALEAIYTSDDWEHQGSLVATERIKWFLGEKTPLYEPGDVPDFVRPRPTTSIGEVVQEVYEVRNYIAHGEKIPDKYFQTPVRAGLQGMVKMLAVLEEAVSFIIRKSLLRILQKGLLNDFANGKSADAYFSKQGLTKTLLKKKPKAAAP